MKSLILMIAVVGVAAVSQSARADFDVSPQLGRGNKIVTNAFDDAAESEIKNVRVFTYEFGDDDESQPYFAQDPGFHPLPNESGFAPGSLLGLQLASPLRYWSGAGTPNFATVSSGESIRYEYGASAAVSSASLTSKGDGFGFIAVDANGEADDHLSSFLLAAGGTTDNPGTPAEGIYLATIILNSDQSGVIASDPLYLIFSNGIGDDVLDEAALAVRDQFAPGSTLAVPEPTSLLVLSAIGPILRRRR